MSTKLPSDAFAYYVSLGPDRSYQGVADHFCVSKKTVTRRATAENWQGQLESVESKARENVQKKIVEDLDEMNERHLKMLRVIQHKALETLRGLPLKTAIDAVRSLDLSIKQERVVLGEPGDRTALSVEDVVRREYDRWMTTEDGRKDGPETELPTAPEGDDRENRTAAPTA